MKVSVSLPDDDVALLDEYVQSQRFESRSAVVHTAVRLLRASQLASAYERAWQEWEDAGDAEAWRAAVGDGLT